MLPLALIGGCWEKKSMRGGYQCINIFERIAGKTWMGAMRSKFTCIHNSPQSKPGDWDTVRL